ncbi:hypothetical protein JYQ62_11275 [Nostoc sp. UHCC 0702]|nr:hypothetical protein JYQ62_11275 [Nostoc sp. UHCC 0702]
MQLSKFLSLGLRSCIEWKSTLLSYLALVSLWILANVASELLEDFSFFLETAFGVTQWLVLRRYIRHLGWWILLSAYGWVIAFVLINVVGARSWIFSLIPPGGELAIGDELINTQILWTRVLVRLLEWVVIAILQWLLLRRYIPHASWWIFASALGGAVKGGVEPVVRLLTAIDELGTIAGAVAYGLVTGVVLVLLLKHQIQHRQHRERMDLYY